MKKILVVGSNGYIAQNLLNNLLQDNSIELVVGIDLDKKNFLKHKKFKYIQCDLFNLKKLIKILKANEINCVVDLSSDYDEDQYNNNPINFYENNIGKLIILFKALRYTYIKNFIYISNFENQIKCFKNNKNGFYNSIKLSCENFIKNISKIHNIRYGILNTSAILGNSNNKNSKYSQNNLIVKIMDAIICKKNSINLNQIFFYDDPNRINFISVDKICKEINDIITHIFNNNKSIQKNIVDDNFYNLNQIILMIMKANNLNIEFSIKNSIINFNYLKSMNLLKFSFDKKTMNKFNLLINEYNFRKK